MARTLFRAAAAAALLCAIVAGCTRAPSVDTRTASLRIGFAAPTLAAQRDIALRYPRSALTTETLVNTGGNGRPVPRIIESWQGSSDGLTWQLKVRQGVRYHDGTTLTAGDVAAQIASPL